MIRLIIFFLIPAFSACAIPRHQLYGEQVVVTDMLGDVIHCKYKSEITAHIHPHSRFAFPGWEYPSNFAVANELQVDARNRAHDLGGNRIMARTRPFKGKQAFAVFACPDYSFLRSYELLTSARVNQSQNLNLFCRHPGTQPPIDYQQVCIGKRPDLPSRLKFQ